MRSTWMSLPRQLLTLGLLALGGVLWMMHADAWSLGTRSPVLGYDSAQYALAARELAEHGRLGTIYALPIELAKHASPPWPLAVVQPGLVLAEALIEALAPPVLKIRGREMLQLQLPHQREWLTLLLPFVCFLVLAAVLSLLAARLLHVHAPTATPWQRALVGAVVGTSFLLDPEAQHFAIGGFTELPFTLGLTGALAALATGRAAKSPWRFGLLMGVTGAFRANMLWLAPLLALAAALTVPGGAEARGRRARVLVISLLVFAISLAPWWLYKWRAFGSPAWDLSRLVLWEGVEGRTWFSLLHLPHQPELPAGLAALGLLARKVLHNLPPLVLALATGPRALWIGTLAVWLILAPRPRPLAVTGWTVLAQATIALLTSALGIPWLRYLFPARVPLEAAGILALFALIAGLPAQTVSAASRRSLLVLVAALALGWGSWQTVRGNAEARATSESRGLPSVLTLRDIGHRLRRELPPGEAVMSNLGPTLAWYSRRPVVHLALTPGDVDACRQKLAFRHVLLVFRDAAHAWTGWGELVERPDAAAAHPEWNVIHTRRWRDEEGFIVVWLELGPPLPALAQSLREGP